MLDQYNSLDVLVAQAEMPEPFLYNFDFKIKQVFIKLLAKIGKRCTPALKKATRSVFAGEGRKVLYFPFPLLLQHFCKRFMNL
ncbi:hypothetical protein FDUTEX481_01647 [Tolypothrix sp. PCC 7601]|nr:hypothetical protein FDUTEX481_01647 [Tolypothrix sp. PCC 7601]